MSFIFIIMKLLFDTEEELKDWLSNPETEYVEGFGGWDQYGVFFGHDIHKNNNESYKVYHHQSIEDDERHYVRCAKTGKYEAVHCRWVEHMSYSYIDDEDE